MVYTGRTLGGRFEARLDASTGAVLTQVTIGDDASQVTTSHEYAAMPGGALLRILSRSRFVNGASGSVRTVTVTYSNHLMR